MAWLYALVGGHKILKEEHRACGKKDRLKATDKINKYKGIGVIG
jgi:hypothetical protein